MTRMKQAFPERTDVVVVGGGLAGLTTATFLARAGYQVTLFEQSQQLGGRAVTHTKNGFYLNLGPRALYRAGQGTKILHELGISFTGSVPALNGGYAIRQGKMYALPVGLRPLLFTRLFGISAKLSVYRLLASLSKIDPKPIQHLTLQEWLNQEIRLPEVRQFFEALVRLTTYANAPELMSAGAALAQVQLAFAGLVTYIDGGWQVLVDGLCQAAQTAGVQLVTGFKVASVEHDRTVRGVCLTDGSVCQTAVVVLATNPKIACQLVGGDGKTSLHQWATALVPVQAACLDVALKRLPRPENLFALGIDQPVYFSVHSAYAKLAPNDGALIHTMKYLDKASSKQDRASIEQKLEGLLDLLQPGWRNELIIHRFLPDITVSNALPTVAEHGTVGHPEPAVPEIKNLYVVGDWLGSDEFLVDAALSRAKQAAEMIVDSRVSKSSLIS